MPKCPIFIIGFPRSGTTLLRAMLGAHPSITLADEPELLRVLRRVGRGLQSTLTAEDRPRLIAAIERIRPAKEFLASVQTEARQWLDAPNPAPITGRQWYESLMEAPQDGRVWGEKSLGNVFHIHEIETVYESSLIVHLVRDPRAAVLSLFRKRLCDSRDEAPRLTARNARFFLQWAHHWNSWIDEVDQQVHTGANVLQLRYEDLVQAPEESMQLLCAELGLSFEPSMLRANSRKRDPALSKGGAFAHQRLLGEVDPARAEAFQELPAWAVDIVQGITAETMAAHGYEFAPAALMRTQSLRLKLAKWCFGARARSKAQRDVAERRGAARTPDEEQSILDASSEAAAH